MPQIAATAWYCFRASVAVLVPGCYLLVGLYCWSSDFSWYGTALAAINHILIFLAAQQFAPLYYRPIIFFVCFVCLGVLVFAAAWICWGGNVYRAFPLALAGSAAWSITSWICTTYLYFARTKAERLRAGSPRIAVADRFLVLLAPLVITAILGAIFAATDPDVRFFHDRVEDFFYVMELGIGCGLFLATPWFCLPFALGLWPAHENGILISGSNDGKLKPERR
jgi:hypothetical protein